MPLLEVDPQNSKMLHRFIDFPYELYKGSSFWVPPLRGELARMLQRGSGMQLSGGPYILYLLEREGRPAARILAGVNRIKNQQHQKNEGYFSLFECVDDPEAARLIVDQALGWLKEQKVDLVTGPVSPSNGDDYRGILVEGLDQVPAINTTYTMDYYPGFLEKLGFEKYLDFYAYRLDFDYEEIRRLERLVNYGRNKLNLTIENIDLTHVDQDIRAIHDVLGAAMLPHWEHLEIPTYEQIYDEFSSIKALIDPSLILIARINRAPVGFVAGLPDYNQALCHINGRLTPWAAAKFLYFKSKIRRVRMFMQFVIPRYQRSIVIAALYLELFRNYHKRGYTDMEASTMAETNNAALANMKGVGFIANRIYRIYQIKV